MTAENWHEERDRLIQLLQGIESGTITHIDEDDLRQLQATTPENIAVLKDRSFKALMTTQDRGASQGSALGSEAEQCYCDPIGRRFREHPSG